MKTLIAVIAALLAASVLAASAIAGKATLAINPDPALVGVPNTLSGCGYVPSAHVRIYISWNTEFKRDFNNGGSFATASDADGCISEVWTPTATGLYVILVVQFNKAGTNDGPKARLVFEVTQ